MGFFSPRRRLKQERIGFTLYGAAVAAARAPLFYSALGVADTLDGRFDLVSLHSWLILHRLQSIPGRDSAAIGQKLFDAMFADMDTNLREIGVGDMSIPKRVRAMWEAFHGRAAAYGAALSAPDPDALVDALCRNVWRTEQAPGAPRLARIVRAQCAHLAAQPNEALLAGSAGFVAPGSIA